MFLDNKLKRMDLILSIIIFVSVLVVYLHVSSHLSVSSDMDVYTVLNIPGEKLDELCGSKQPFVAKNDMNPLHGVVRGALDGIDEFCVRTTGAYDAVDVPPLMVGRLKADKLFSRSGDVGSVKYYSRGNWEGSRASLVDEGVVLGRDDFFSPPMTVCSTSDFIMGEMGACTSLRYEVAHRTFLYAFDGRCTVVLSPPDRFDKLGVIKDYELFEFRSSRDPSSLLDKDVMRVDLEVGDTLYVPPYWFYCIQLGADAKVHLFQYYTALNVLSTMNHHLLHQLQLNNIKFGYDSAKPIDFGPLNDEVVGDDDVVGDDKVDDEASKKNKNKKSRKKSVVFSGGVDGGDVISQK